MWLQRLIMLTLGHIGLGSSTRFQVYNGEEHACASSVNVTVSSKLGCVTVLLDTRRGTGDSAHLAAYDRVEKKCSICTSLTKQKINSGNTNKFLIAAIVDGSWSTWTAWTDCPTTCRGDTQTRTRSCVYTANMPQGQTCAGDSSEERNCTTPFCSEFLDCSDVMRTGLGDGVYTIIIESGGINVTKEVFCDLTNDGGGWTVVQTRFDGSENFYRNFADYDSGFGTLTSEFWLGLQWLYKITSRKPYQVRFDVTAFNGTTGFIKYSSFSIAASPLYTLTVTGIIDGDLRKLLYNVHITASPLYTLTVTGIIDGDLPDNIPYHNGMAFSTLDRDMDMHATEKCTDLSMGGFWYNLCTTANINGIYNPGSADGDTMNWRDWPSVNRTGLKQTKMSVKPF